MSPPPPIDSDSTQSLVKDGLVASILGGLAMTARLLLSTEPVSPGWVLRRITAAAITAALVGYGIADHIASPGLRMAVVGASGYAAPEVMDYVLKYVKARGEAEVAKVTKKPNAKKKPTKRRK
jgi:uncharacterized protein YlxP (DUF503 family)